MTIKLTGGETYDPVNQIDGEVKDPIISNDEMVEYIGSEVEVHSTSNNNDH
ncbi:MAG: hypothetical protein AAF304_03390 [Pseudomonadota bacterium]